MRRPRLASDLDPVPGVAALALFGVLAAVILTAGFDAPAGFEAGASVMEGIGYALFDLADQSPLVTEGFLFAFLAIAVVLDAALDGALLLARREGGDES
ncbi:hypothetical protein [Halapricum desulfuricans]|uniref:NADH dehydrogenase subunit J2 n=1 Tax=Halapricum desulfuricans TaxID=2841257 RepID=A0A897NV49_9EURY|nr:hypothetical protein [Halapricum desulfuricans]QSG14663.1 NADH dehydrogenase subunit J2 [Halapricum desulfuricans]